MGRVEFVMVGADLNSAFIRLKCFVCAYNRAAISRSPFDSRSMASFSILSTPTPDTYEPIVRNSGTYVRVSGFTLKFLARITVLTGF